MENATIHKSDPNLVPDVRVRVDYNDGLHLGSFAKSNEIWAGTQKKGVAPEIPGGSSYSDHVTQALETEFCITKEIPIPPETIGSSEWISTTPRGEILCFRKSQFPALQKHVLDATQSQAVWTNLTPQVRKPATGRFQAVDSTQLLIHFNLGGDRWIGQFAHGSPLRGLSVWWGTSLPQIRLFLRQLALNNFGTPPPLSGSRKEPNHQVLKMPNRFGAEI